MRYENRQAPEGINVSKVHPLKQFAQLLVAAAILIVVIVVLLQISGGWLGKQVPFKYEQSLMEQVDVPFGDANAPAELVDYLNDLATRLTQNMPLPQGMSVEVHYSGDDVFNAFATLGGNLLFYRGLLEEMPHENALAMVMAHEIAHIWHRDPMVSLGGGVVSMVAVSMITGQSGFASSVLNKTSLIAGTQFTRKMESAADAAALSAIAQLYGHVDGADALFEVMGEYSADSKVPDWLERFSATHPLSADRLASIATRANEAGWAQAGDLTPLPANFKNWLRGDIN